MFITVEGIDGSGKTSVSRLLGKSLPNATVLHRKEFVRHAPIQIKAKVEEIAFPDMGEFLT